MLQNDCHQPTSWLFIGRKCEVGATHELHQQVNQQVDRFFVSRFFQVDHSEEVSGKVDVVETANVAIWEEIV